MKKIYIKFLSLLSIMVLLLNLTGCKKTEAKPILKVITKSSVGGISSLSNTNFFIIYDNEKKKQKNSIILFLFPIFIVFLMILIIY